VVESIAVPSPEASPPAEVAVAPAATPAPVAEVVKPSEEPKVVEAPKPSEEPKLVETPKPSEPPSAAGGDYQALLKEGKSLYGRGQSKKAVTPLEQAIALKPDGDEAFVVLANCWLDRGNLTKALVYAQDALKANPENADAYVVVGAVEQQNNHNGEAKTAYEKYLKLAPKGQYAGDIRAILKTLK
jgi:tetratricopeptide (TPR) repeat protein